MTYRVYPEGGGGGGEVIPPGAVAGQILQWDGAAWVAGSEGTSTGQLLVWNGTSWVPTNTTRGSMARQADTDALTIDGAVHTLDDWDGTSGTTATGVTESKAGGSWTILTTGTYRLGATLFLTLSGNVTAEFYLAVDGTMIDGCQWLDNDLFPTNHQFVLGEALVDLTAGDVITVDYAMTDIQGGSSVTVSRATFTIQRVA